MRVHYASPSVERVLGYKPAQVVGIPALEYIHPEDLLNAIYTFSNALLNPGMALPIELRIQHQDGSWRMLEASTQKFIDQTGVRSVVVNCRDITERQRVSEIRRALERKELKA
jgi:PAS domain S-box-containing protein